MHHRGNSSRLRHRLLRSAILVLSTGACLAGQGNPPQVGPGGAGETVAPWERRVRGAYENNGLAQIERLGNRWVLNVMCDGTHATYIDDTDLDLAGYSKGYVSVRYQYVDRTISNPKCFRAPCAPLHERRIALERVTIVPGSPEQARELARDCRLPAGEMRVI